MQIVIISKSGLQKTPRDDAVEMIFNLCLVESKHVMYMHINLNLDRNKVILMNSISYKDHV
jgi:hypothetical protein